MNRPDPEALVRWVDEAAAPGTAEARAAAIVRSMGEPDLPGDDRMAAIRSRIALQRGPRRSLRMFTLALVVTSLFVGATLGAAARGWIEPLLGPVRARLQESRKSPPPPTARRARSSALVPRAPAAASLPAEELPPAQSAPEEDPPASPARPAAVRPSLAPPRVAGVGASDEAGLLGLAIRRLRREHDPRRALAALDDLARRFPAGALGEEADLVRVETLLALDDRAAALRVLEGRDLATAPRARHALALRGELRAAAGRCAEAIADLDLPLRSPSSDAVAERGLFARASCLTSLRRYPEARRDLDDYLRRFPDGPHAAAAAEALRGLPAAK